MSLKQHNNLKGFSIIELAIGMVLVGLFVSSALSMYLVESKKLSLNNTKGRMNVYSSALEVFMKENGRYPCPAAPMLTPNDPEYGKEACPSSVLTPDGTCTATGLCRIIGVRDSDGDAVLNVVLRGVVPFKSLNMPLNVSSNDVTDGWGRHFAYYITEILTNTGTYNNLGGAIAPRTLAGFVAPGTDNVKGTLISYGPDGKGAYTGQGQLVQPCVAGQRDSTNCDMDAFFYVQKGAEDAEQRSLSGGAENYDDFVQMAFFDQTAKWTQSNVDADDMYSQNIGNVGIGVQAPTERIHVDGNVLVDKMQAVNFCDEDGADCFPADMIAGAGISCDVIAGGAQAMTGISNTNAECDLLYLPATLTGTCPVGDYVTGFDATGAVVCATP